MANLKTVMLGLAARDYQRRNPQATEAAAWAFARRHFESYRQQAVTFLTLIELDRQTTSAARQQRN